MGFVPVGDGGDIRSSGIKLKMGSVRSCLEREWDKGPMFRNRVDNILVGLIIQRRSCSPGCQAGGWDWNDPAGPFQLRSSIIL